VGDGKMINYNESSSIENKKYNKILSSQYLIFLILHLNSITSDENRSNFREKYQKNIQIRMHQ